MGLLEGVLVFSGLVAYGAEPSKEILESKLETRSGFLERWVYDSDERNFGVKLIKPEGEVVWLETPARTFSINERIVREPLHFIDGKKYEAVVLERDQERKILGLAPRQFEAGSKKEICSALGRANVPTPLHSSQFFPFVNLACDESKKPMTETKEIAVLGRDDRSWVNCKMAGDVFSRLCQWVHRYPSEPEAAAQVATYSFLWRARGELFFNGLDAFMPKLTGKSWAFNSDRSVYDAVTKTLFYGSGAFPDGLDGFVVIHEWGHALLDHLNPGMWGYESQVIHEGIADYIPQHIFKDPCFAPFDAQEIPNRICVRQASGGLTHKDMHWDDPHHDSQVLSGILWEAEKIVAPGIVFEMALETAVRLSKSPSLQEFWEKFLSSYARLLSERPLLEDHMIQLKSLGERRGLSGLDSRR